MVVNPGAALKTGGTACPRRAQSKEGFLAPGSPGIPKFFSSAVTKSEGVIPKFKWGLTDVTILLESSSKTRASAICSLGFSTGAQRHHS
jgi:hypothetical protein